ncbi:MULTISPECIES: alanine--tRNA ligase [unclassified Variovorax]|uniref:alanine--tRNA ligase n=1 Tax=unclassified Variovorax TaxID=663243 RepID=UPI0025757BA5|nr:MULTISPECIES: alanine--tRNA ligase [unclassified Variovorax]MDM0086088.1 alanine--tRNA ligase [Variovorax sp. J22G40]MDM0145655.1 alanine--tRNA ligase [Variovorax sp. J2P1-31]
MSQPTFTVADIRKTFLDFFASKGHTIVPSSPLVPGNDPTLMFTNSGMVQFKDVFLGEDKRPYQRATSVQACLRAGGKHNDLENVGYTARHHTFFEMLGNWSFGDYFKRESLQWAFELLTQVYKLPAEKLWATVYIEDDEAYDIWTKEIGLPPERVVRIGDNKGGRYMSDNFWMMADTGPCGPCSEIFYDHGPEIAGGPPGSPDEDGDRYIEIWNNVFMQFDMQPDGSVRKLPAPCVDTGMGLERLAAILQHVHSNYEIDLFDKLVKAAARETHTTDLDHKSLRVIADHIRATAFLVTDGVIPSNEGRGYVQRRIIRRAIRHGYLLGQKKPFFHKLVADLVTIMGDAYPKLVAEQKHITDTLKAEEERFFETLANGMDILNSAMFPSEKVAIARTSEHPAHTDIERVIGSAESPQSKVLPGDVAFKLHDTFGFPLDLTADVCREQGWSIDEAGFNAAMEKQKAAGRAAGKFKMDRNVEYAGAGNTFTGYEHLEAQATVQALYFEGAAVPELKEGQPGIVVLDTTPFYSESGGQVGDQGALSAEGVQFGVDDTQKIKADVFGHHGTQTQGTLKVGDTVKAAVDGERRHATMRNHSVTHLMHKALREVLGTHVQQKGSLVDADKTRFDFAHNAAVTREQILEIEKRVNAEILANAATQARVMDIESAQKTGAMMLFGEKYGETVRVLDIGSSRELCGGTHVSRTGDIGLFKITSESGVAAGVRRIEAITGANALAYLQALESAVQTAAQTLKSTPAEVQARLAQLLDQMKVLEREVGTLKGKLASSKGDELIAQAIDLGGLKLLVAQLDGGDAKTLRDTMDKLKDKLKSAVIVLAIAEGAKVQLAAGVTADALAKVKAGELVNFVAQQVGGKGGGKPDMAMAGGTDPSGLAAALASVQGWVAERV